MQQKPWTEAMDALSSIARLEKDLLLLNAQTQIKQQIQRIAFGLASFAFLNAALVLGFYWLTQLLRDHGVSPVWLMLLSFVVLGGVCFLFLARAMRPAQASADEIDETTRFGRA